MLLNSIFSEVNGFIPKGSVSIAVILFLVSACLSLVTALSDLRFKRTKLKIDTNIKNDNENNWSNIVNEIADSPATELSEKKILQLRRCLGAFKWSEYNSPISPNNFYAFKDVSIDVTEEILTILRRRNIQYALDKEATMLRLIARELVQDRWETYKIYREQITHPFLSRFGTIRNMKEKQEHERNHAKMELQNYLNNRK